MTKNLFPLLVAAVWWAALSCGAAPVGPLRVLFLGHEAEHHPSKLYYPMLAKALGREAIYFDYVTTPEAAFGDAEYLGRFDAVLLYANHQTLDRALWNHLKGFVENGGGFVPVHCASWCFQNIPEYDRLVGGRFKSHQTGIFQPRTVLPEHGAIEGVPGMEAWDETYVHGNHHETNRTVLQVREALPGEALAAPEPWTWVREEGKGRVFYTASGHDERVWSREEFHALLKAGILWAVGEERRATYEAFLERRTPLRYEKRDDIPNYEKRPEPLAYQFPLTPEESMDYTQVPVGWRLELFAAEPDIVNPIFLTWDERGRLWVGETTDYPNEVRPEGGNDRIKILEDVDGDGRCDLVTVFADGLNIPTGMTFANGGVIVAQAPHFLFLKDEDGDGVADVREVLLTGWGTQDTHAGPSNLRRGFDNWVWGAVGYAGFKGRVGGEPRDFRSGIFRMRGDSSRIEFVAQFNNNTWGLGFNESGDVFGSTANRNPSFFCGLPETVYRETKRMSAKMIADTAVFHPITPNIRQVDAFGEYTSAAGHAFAASPGFPESMRDRRAFVCGPTGNLLGAFDVEAEGAGYRARNAFAMVASADEWFSPVAAEVGPDGNLWIADWYNFIIQHNPTPTVERGGYAAQTGLGNAHVNPNRDRERGRVYRLIWEGAPVPERRTLAGAGTLELVAALDDGNLFWRQTAQRLLVDEDRKEAAEVLRMRVRQPGVGAIHALWTLEGLGELDRETHLAALLGADGALKKNAIRAIPATAEGERLFYDTAVMADRDPQVRLAAFAKLAMLPDEVNRGMVANRLLVDPSNRGDDWLKLALEAAGGGKEREKSYELGENLLPNPSFEEMEAEEPRGWRVRHYSGDAEHQLVRSGDGVRSGKGALSIRSQEGADTSWFAGVELKPETEYRLSGWIKTSKVSQAAGALLNVHELQRTGKTAALQKDNGWTEVEQYFGSGKGGRMTVNLLFGGWGKATGQAWYDDVALQEVIPGVKDAGSWTGDATRGRAIFQEHPVASCSRCHLVGGEGGPIGPPLDGIAARKDADYLRESLVDPQATMAEGYPAELSPMPPMGVLLTEQELEDVLAYLLTLR